MKKIQKNRRGQSLITNRLRKLMVNSLFAISVLPIIATSASLGFSSTEKVSAIYGDGSGDGGWRPKPPGFGGGFIPGFVMGLGGGYLAAKALTKTETNDNKNTSSSKKKDFSSVSKKVNNIFSSIAKTDVLILDYEALVEGLPSDKRYDGYQKAKDLKDRARQLQKSTRKLNSEIKKAGSS